MGWNVLTCIVCLEIDLFASSHDFSSYSVWDSNPATPSTRQINVFLPPYEIPGAVYDVVYQQRPNGPLIPAGTVETDNRDPVPFTISDLQPGTPYQLFITARVGPRRSDRSRPLDTQTTDDSKLNGIGCMYGAWPGKQEECPLRMRTPARQISFVGCDRITYESEGELSIWSA